MFARCPWRRSESVEPTSPRGNTRGSGNSGADAFLITAPLSHTPPSTLRSTNTLHLFAVPRLRRTYERSVHSIRKVLAITFFSMASFLADLWSETVFTTLFLFVQPPHSLETGVWQLHDRRNSRAAVRRDHVGVQHRGGQHGEEATRGLFCAQPERKALHHHLIPKVLSFYKSRWSNSLQYSSLDSKPCATNSCFHAIYSTATINWSIYRKEITESKCDHKWIILAFKLNADLILSNVSIKWSSLLKGRYWT